MPSTFMKYFYLGANLHGLVSSIAWPKLEIYEQWKIAFHSAFKDTAQGTRYAELFSFISSSGETTYPYDAERATTLPPLIHRQLRSFFGRKKQVSALGQFVPDVSKAGVKFATASSSKRNSFVLFSKSNAAHDVSTTRAACVQEIFYHRRVKGG